MTSILFHLLLIAASLVTTWLPQDIEHLDVVSYPVNRNVEAGTFCGMYSLKAAAVAVGNDIPSDALFDSTYLSSPFGSTASDILRAASDHGLNARQLYGPDYGSSVNAWWPSFGIYYRVGKLRSNQIPLIRELV